MTANFERRERIRRMIDASLCARGRPPTVREIAQAEGITVSNAWRYGKKIKEGYRR